MRFGIAAGLTAVIAAAAAAAGFYLSASKTESTAAGVPFARAAKPTALPALRFVDDSGRARSLAEFRGKVVLLNIWATWCAPCREEMPALDRLQAKLGGSEFQVLALSIDQQGTLIARTFFDETGIKALELYNDPSAQAAFKVGAPGVPSTLLVDREGREIGRHAGPAKWDAPEIVEDLARRVKGQKR